LPAGEKSSQLLDLFGEGLRVSTITVTDPGPERHAMHGGAGMDRVLERAPGPFRLEDLGLESLSLTYVAGDNDIFQKLHIQDLQHKHPFLEVQEVLCEARNPCYSSLG
jgi:hypothetical protein